MIIQKKLLRGLLLTNQSRRGYDTINVHVCTHLLGKQDDFLSGVFLHASLALSLPLSLCLSLSPTLSHLHLSLSLALFLPICVSRLSSLTRKPPVTF